VGPISGLDTVAKKKFPSLPEIEPRSSNLMLVSHCLPVFRSAVVNYKKFHISRGLSLKIFVKMKIVIDGTEVVT